MAMFNKDAKVIHPKYGAGVVLADLGDSVLVRFESEIQSCLPSSLEKVASVGEMIESGANSRVDALLPLLQAKCIKSVNDQWGVFSRSQIDLLPHQLWVCRQARLKDPCRLLVADDVGLGKTIEAGLILSAMLTSGKLHRLLILTPASLVDQWVKRMFEMFDIRAERYRAEADTEKSNFWAMHDFVVASLDTLKLDRPDRKERMLSSEPWDLVLVDEAHHLNNDPKMGATLGYELLAEINDRKLAESMIFFTGTPHKGKNFSFVSLLRLLAPDVFDPHVAIELQLDRLKDYMIRNNKYNVTDLRGNLLFQEPVVKSATYSYTAEEQAFYDKLTEFISTGMAYASSLTRETGSIVMFVLITMQKLASSSVAAVSNAIRRRIAKFEAAIEERKNLSEQLKVLESEDESDGDERSRVEERLLELAAFVQIGNNEIVSLKELLSLADKIKEETKFRTLMDCVAREYNGKSVLFFTEYKATQSKLMSMLMEEYGEDAVTIINGDEALEEVRFPNGVRKRFAVSREVAAEEFNAGKRRFMISTEAAGEGIDLEENCHIIIHVDLPWNPMRLHQRVGRLNRFGQTEKVEVLSMRNPDTVESRIWAMLNRKLGEIDKMLGAVMEKKEDITQLVLGMTQERAVQDVFAFAPPKADDETLAKWWDAKSATIGGKDVVKTVKDVFGNVSRFNYQQVSSVLPRVDLPDLLPFWKNILAFRGRRLSVRDDGLEFVTPNEWREFGVFSKYEGLTFNRRTKDKKKILGTGHKVFNNALADALKIKAAVAATSSIDNNLLFFSVHDKVTDSAKEKGARIYVCEVSSEKKLLRVLADWEALKAVDEVSLDSDAALPWTSLDDGLIRDCESAINAQVSADEFAPQVPVITLEAALLAGSRQGRGA